MRCNSWNPGVLIVMPQVQIQSIICCYICAIIWAKYHLLYEEQYLGLSFSNNSSDSLMWPTNGCPTIRSYSDTSYPMLASDFISLRAQSYKTVLTSGAPGWLSQASNLAQVMISGFVGWAPCRALCWQLKPWRLLWILCLPLSLPLLLWCSVFVSLSKINIKKKYCPHWIPGSTANCPTASSLAKNQGFPQSTPFRFDNH